MPFSSSRFIFVPKENNEDCSNYNNNNDNNNEIHFKHFFYIKLDLHFEMRKNMLCECKVMLLYMSAKHELVHTYLTHFNPMFHFYTPRERQKISGFLTF